MVTVSSGGPGTRGSVRLRGFSLIELITALAVVGVASTIFVSLLNQGMGLGRSARNRTIAVHLAEAQLGALQQHPERFLWPAALPGQDRFPVTSMEPNLQGYTPVAPPSVFPTDQRSRARETAIYEDFSWQAYGRFATDDAPYCELSVEIHWTESGRDRAFVLTSAMPRSASEIPWSQAAQPKAEAAQ